MGDTDTSGEGQRRDLDDASLAVSSASQWTLQLSRIRLLVTPWTTARLAVHQLPKRAQTHVHCIADAIQTSHPLSSPSPPAFNPNIRVFSNESALRIEQSNDTESKMVVTRGWQEEGKLSLDGSKVRFLQHGKNSRDGRW